MEPASLRYKGNIDFGSYFRDLVYFDFEGQIRLDLGAYGSVESVEWCA